MEAQTKAPSVVGEYYLTGVRETACGFKLNGDSSFQFFFSYGALDRFGEGRWTAKGNTISFNSKLKREHDFALLKSSAGPANKIIIEFKEMNEFLQSHVYCKIKGGGKEQEGMTDSHGSIVFEAQPIDSIELILEFCPEKKSVFIIPAGNHHSFEFKPEPWLMEVFFQDFTLTLDKDELVGGHPLSNETSFRYEKNN